MIRPDKAGCTVATCPNRLSGPSNNKSTCCKARIIESCLTCCLFLAPYRGKKGHPLFVDSLFNVEWTQGRLSHLALKTSGPRRGEPANCIPLLVLVCTSPPPLGKGGLLNSGPLPSPTCTQIGNLDGWARCRHKVRASNASRTLDHCPSFSVHARVAHSDVPYKDQA